MPTSGVATQAQRALKVCRLYSVPSPSRPVLLVRNSNANELSAEDLRRLVQTPIQRKSKRICFTSSRSPPATAPAASHKSFEMGDLDVDPSNVSPYGHLTFGTPTYSKKYSSNRSPTTPQPGNRVQTAPPGPRPMAALQNSPSSTSAATAPVSATKIMRQRAEQKQHQHEKNPFIQYEDKGQLLQQKRRWLWSDDHYVHHWADSVKRSGMTNRKIIDGLEKDTLFDNRLLYCHTAHKAIMKKLVQEHHDISGGMQTFSLRNDANGDDGAAGFAKSSKHNDFIEVDGRFNRLSKKSTSVDRTTGQERGSEVKNLMSALKDSHTRLKRARGLTDDVKKSMRQFRGHFKMISHRLRGEKQAQAKMQKEQFKRSLTGGQNVDIGGKSNDQFDFQAAQEQEEEYEGQKKMNAFTGKLVKISRSKPNERLLKKKR